MKHFILPLFLLVALATNAQDSIFSRVYRCNGAYEINSVAVDPHYRFAQVGKVEQAHGVFTYLDSVGNVLNSETYTISGDDGESDFLRVISSSDSNFLVVGAIQYSGAPIDMGLVMKVDSTGDVIWSTIVFEGNAIAYRAKDAVELSNGNWMTIVQNESHGKCALVQLDPNGAFISTNGFSLPDDDRLEINSLRALNDSTFVLVGSGLVQNIQTAIAFVVDDNGTVLWSYSFTGGQYYECEVNESSIWLLTNFNNSGIGITSLTHSGIFTSGVSYMDNDGMDEKFGLCILQDSTLAMVQGNPFNSSLVVATVGELNATLHSIYVNTTDVAVSREHGIAIVGTGPTYGIKSLYEPQTGFIHLDSLANGDICSNQETSNPVSSATVNTGITINSGIGYTAQPITLTHSSLIVDITGGCVDRYGSVDELDQDFVVLYPNPTNSDVSIQFKESVRGTIELHTTDGKLIQRKAVSPLENIIPLTGISAGCYLYRFTLENADSKSVSGILIIE